MRQSPAVTFATTAALTFALPTTLPGQVQSPPAPGVLSTAADDPAATVGSWVSIGPAPMAYSQDPDEPDFFNSGRVASIAVDPADHAHWLLGAGNGGLWETRNGGASWLPIAEDAPTPAIGAVAFAPSNPQIIYVGTGESASVGFAKIGVGVMKSVNGGTSWGLLGAATFARATVKRLRVHPADPDVVLAATARGGFGRESSEGAPVPPPYGIQRSTDGGVTWTRRLAGQATALEVDATNFNHQYAAIGDLRVGVLADTPGAIGNGVYRSIDGGVSWLPVSGPWGPNPSPTVASVGRIELALSPSNPSVLYAAISRPPNGGPSSTPLLGLYRTDNAWAPAPTWLQVPTTNTTAAGAYCDPKCSYSHVISVDPANPDTLFGGGAEHGLWACMSCDGTPRWQNTTHWVRVHTDHHAMAWAGARLIVGSDGGVWSSPDRGASWQNHNRGLSTAMFFSGALHATNRDLVIGGIRDFQVTTRNGDNRWVITGHPAQGEWGEADVAMSRTRPDTDWMAGWINGDIQRTTDGGVTVTRADAGIDKTGAAFVAPVRKCPAHDDVFLTGTNRLWRTNNFFSGAAVSWVQNSAVHPSTAGTVLAIGFAPSDPSCSTYAYANRGGEVYLTQNGGASWTNLDLAQNLPRRPINGLTFHPASPATLYLAFSSFDNATPGKPGHIFRTENALASSPTWVDISPPVDVPFNVLAIDPRHPTLVYAGSDSGLWQSIDGGAQWIRKGLPDGMPTASVYDIQINPVTDQTVAFTYGRGAYRLVTTSSSIHPPTNLRILSISGRRVTVAFDPPADTLPPTGYLLEGGTIPGQALAALPIAGSASGITFEAPTGAFYVRVHALSGSARSLASNEVRLFVNVPVPPSAPRNLLSSVHGSTVSLAWMNTALGGTPTRTRIIVDDPFSVTLALPLTEAITVPGAPPGVYTISVRANNDQGGTTSPEVLRFTVPGVCAPPEAPAAFAVTKTGNRLDLTWALPPAGDAPTGFVVRVVGAVNLAIPLTSRSVGGVVGPGTYTLSVASTNSCGASPPAASQTVTVP